MTENTDTTDDEQTPPFRYIEPYSDALHSIEQMRGILDDLEQEITTARWIALGGRGAFAQTEAAQNARALESWREKLETQVEQLPDPYDKGDRWKGSTDD